MVIPWTPIASCALNTPSPLAPFGIRSTYVYGWLFHVGTSFLIIIEALKLAQLLDCRFRWPCEIRVQTSPLSSISGVPSYTDKLPPFLCIFINPTKRKEIIKRKPFNTIWKEDKGFSWPFPKEEWFCKCEKIISMFILDIVTLMYLSGYIIGFFIHIWIFITNVGAGISFQPLYACLELIAIELFIYGIYSCNGLGLGRLDDNYALLHFSVTVLTISEDSFSSLLRNNFS